VAMMVPTGTDDVPEDEGIENPLRGVLGASRAVVRGAIVDLVSRALLAAALAGGVAIGAFAASGSRVPAWIAVTVVVLAGLVSFGAYRRIRRLRKAVAAREERIGELERQAQESADLRARLEACERRLLNYKIYGEHIAVMMDHLQQVFTGTLPEVTLEHLLERGVLQAGRDALLRRARGDIRLSIIVPDGTHFRMPWAAGQNLERQVKFRMPINGSLMGQVLAKGTPRNWGDVTKDEDFKLYPGTSGPFRSLVSLPVRVGDGVGAVFTVTSSEADAFDPADLTYITSLGSVVDLIVGPLLDGRAGKGSAAASDTLENQRRENLS
jgi:hypothetical protein